MYNNILAEVALPTVTETAQGISNYGMMAMTAAFFLLLSAAMMISVFKWFKNIINNIVEKQDETMKELLSETRNQNAKLDDIVNGLRPTTLQQVKSLSCVHFDLSVERVCRIIKRIRTENHIADKDATKEKIHTLLSVVFESRNSEIENWSYKGRALSEYTNPEWIEWVSQVVEKEIYHEDGVNNGRAYTNVNAVYDKIKFDFYHRLLK